MYLIQKRSENICINYRKMQPRVDGDWIAAPFGCWAQADTSGREEGHHTGLVRGAGMPTKLFLQVISSSFFTPSQFTLHAFLHCFVVEQH